VRFAAFRFRARDVTSASFLYVPLVNPCFCLIFAARKSIVNLLFDAAVAAIHIASMQRSAVFLCLSCGAKYRVTRIEASTEPTPPIACIACDEPLSGREGEFFLKYFLIERPKETRAVPLQAS
jgi:hypothetical protein